LAGVFLVGVFLVGVFLVAVFFAEDLVVDAALDDDFFAGAAFLVEVFLAVDAGRVALAVLVARRVAAALTGAEARRTA
jgi:hypothetical protein